MISKINFNTTIIKTKIMKIPFDHFLDCTTNLMVDIFLLDGTCGGWERQKKIKFGKNEGVELESTKRGFGKTTSRIMGRKSS